jgi:hypothetical protein
MLLHRQLRIQCSYLLFDGLNLSVTLSFDHTVAGTHEGQHVTVGSYEATSQLIGLSELLIIKGLHENTQFLLLAFEKPLEFEVGMCMKGCEDLLPDEKERIILLSVLGGQLVALK